MDSRLLSALISRWERKATSREVLVAEIETTADAAWELIQAGNGEVSFVKNSSLNSKSVNLDAVMTSVEVLSVMEEALAYLTGQEAPTRITYADLRNVL